MVLSQMASPNDKLRTAVQVLHTLKDNGEAGNDKSEQEEQDQAADAKDNAGIEHGAADTFTQCLHPLFIMQEMAECYSQLPCLFR